MKREPPLLDKNGNWLRKEKFTDTKAIGVHLDINGKKVETDAGMIVYSKTGTHVYPRNQISMKITKDLEGKRVKITDIDNEIFEGIVSDYIYPEDNEPEGVAGICIEDCPQRPGDWIGFNEHDIKEIKITD